MRSFKHYTAASFEDAAKVLKDNPGSQPIAGGSDLLGVMKSSILPAAPECVVDLKRIPDADKIEEKDGAVEIGALTTLTDISENAVIKEKLPALAKAAYSVASPLVRNVATIGGNLCQDTRCWFYRYPHICGGRLNCYRKDGEECYAICGNNRYHSIFGGVKLHKEPCSLACPAGTNIPVYMSKLRANDYDGAAKVIMKDNPMPMLTSRVCAHFCEGECNRGVNGKSVAIHEVERNLGDFILKNADTYYAAPPSESGKQIALVGAGPAGLAAAFYLRKAGHSVTIYDKQPEAGGCLRYAIPEYRLPKHYVQDFVKAYEKMGIRFELGKEMGKDFTTEDLEQKYDKIFYATGAWKRPILGFDGEEFTEFGLQFLTEVKDWVDKKKRTEVVVIGGGNVAMDVALTLKRLGTEKVILACLEQRYEMPASVEEIARAEEEGVVIMNGWGISRALYDNEKIVGMEIKKCVSVFDENGRFNPTYDDKDLQVINGDSVLLATGQAVDLSFLGDVYVNKTRRGLIEVNEETQKTSRENVFAGGDAVLGPATVIQAVYTGRRAAEAIIKELGLCIGKEDERISFVTYDVEGVKKEDPVKAKELPLGERTVDKEDSMTVTDDEAVSEAKRCMNCACYAVSPSDIAPVLIALGAKLVTTEREVYAEDLLCAAGKIEEALNPGELITKIIVPVEAGGEMRYDKFRLREAIDFAIISLASVIRKEGGEFAAARLVLGGVAPIPYRLYEVERFLINKPVNEETINAAADLAAKDCFALEFNAFKIIELKAMIKKVLSGEGWS